MIQDQTGLGTITLYPFNDVDDAATAIDAIRFTLESCLPDGLAFTVVDTAVEFAAPEGTSRDQGVWRIRFNVAPLKRAHDH